MEPATNQRQLRLIMDFFDIRQKYQPIGMSLLRDANRQLLELGGEKVEFPLEADRLIGQLGLANAGKAHVLFPVDELE